MSETAKKGFGKIKVGLIISIVLMIALACSTIWFVMDAENLQNQVNSLQTDKTQLEIQLSSIQTEKGALQAQLDSSNVEIAGLNAQVASLDTQLTNLEEQISSLDFELGILRSPKQIVVNELEENFGFDVTFVYYGSNETLTFGTENCAIVVMLTNEHVSNFQFTSTQEQQFSEGKNALQTAYPNAEVFLVFILEDVDGDGSPDSESNGYSEISGGVYGGRSETAFPRDYWTEAEYYVGQW